MWQVCLLNLGPYLLNIPLLTITHFLKFQKYSHLEHAPKPLGLYFGLVRYLSTKLPYLLNIMKQRQMKQRIETKIPSRSGTTALEIRGPLKMSFSDFKK